MAHAALALEQLGRDGVVTGLGEAARAVADPLVHAPDLGQAHDDRRGAARRRPRLVDGHAVVADLDLELAGRDAARVRRDRLRQSLVDADRVAGEGGATRL